MRVRIALVAQLLLLLMPVMGHAERLCFAVAPCPFTGDATQAEWIGDGITFDLEKRLERWTALEKTERPLHGPLKRHSPTDEQAAKIVFGDATVDVAITVAGDCSGGKLDVVVKLWLDKSNPVHTLRFKDAVGNLFALDDKLTVGLVSALRASFPALPAPEKPDRLHIAPAKSIRAYEHIIRAMDALRKADASEARPNIEKALELEPGNWWAYYFLGKLEFRDRNNEKAVEYCHKAISLDPDLYAGVYANLAYCYHHMRDTERFEWAKGEFERRTGNKLPMGMRSGGFGR